MVIDWLTDLETVGHRAVPPDPDVLSAIGLSHSMTSALADLVDNSLDAGADRVLIRYVRRAGQLISLVVIDDGRGMDDGTIDRAMTIGARREHGASALGHFGMGLKAASFSQADALTALSRTVGGEPVGRRLVRGAAAAFTCDVIDPAQVRRALDGQSISADHGTIVRWDQVRVFPASSDPAVTEDYLTRSIQEIRAHLGLVLHRLLDTDRLQIHIDVFDITTGESGPAQQVEPIDPFGYRHPGAAGYPKLMTVRAAGHTVPVDCHIWPARSEALGFRLGLSADRGQGFYFYRHDRLLQSGDWKGAAVAHRRTQLARVAVDISNHLDLFTMSMEKNSVQPRAEFIRAVEKAAAADGTDFNRFITDAQEAYRLGNQRNAGRRAVVPPGPGLGPEIKRAAAHELPFLEDRDPIEIRWTNTVDGDDFFRVDRAAQTLWLNARYRSALLGGRRGSLNDAPMIKALLYLLTEEIFHGLSYGPRDKDNVEIWQAILTAAVEAERDDQ